MEKNNQKIYEMLKKNKSLEPIAELVRLVMIAKNTAARAEEIGDKLSVFACQAESSKENLPPISAWMKLCDKYKKGARDFASILKDAVEASQIGDLNKNLHQYTEEIMEQTAWLVENDEGFRRMFEEIVLNDDDDDDEE